MAMLGMASDDGFTSEDVNKIWADLANAPAWCARHEPGMLLKSLVSGNIFETVSAPRLEDGLLMIKVVRVGAPDYPLDLRVSMLEPVDGLTALGEQAE